MGKSKRIRADRARNTFESPERFEKKNEAKKAKLTTIVLVCVLAAIIVLTTTLVVLDNTGTFLRASIVYQSDNFAIDGMMTTYMYNSTYSSWYSQLGEYTSYYINESYITSQAESILLMCEAAKAEGYTLVDEDYAKIDKSINTIKDAAREAGYSLGQLYGQGVTEKDIRNLLELQQLASKIQSDKQDSVTDSFLSDAEAINKYFEENKTSLLAGAYVSAKTANAEWRTQLLAAETVEQFKSTFIKLYVTDKFVAEYQKSEKDKADADKTPVALLEALAKAAVEAVDFVLYDTKVVNAAETEIKLDGSSTKVTAAMIKAIYDGKYRDAYITENGDAAVTAVTDAVYKAAATAADSLRALIAADLKTNSNYTYPNKTTVSKDDYLDTTTGETLEKPETTTTAAGTTAAGTTAAGSTTKEDTTPAKPEELNLFDTWFFSGDRKEKDKTEIADMVYFVTAAAVKDEELTKNIAHILISAEDHHHSESETVDAEHKAEEEAKLAEAKAKAEAVLAEFKAGTMNRETFEALADKYTDDTGVVYENVLRDEMVKEFNDWIYDEARQTGDTAVVKTDYGFHVMYFLGNGIAAWQAETVDMMVGEAMDDWMEELGEKYAVNKIQAGIDRVFG